MKVKVDGYKIRSHKTGKLWPKVYKSEEAVEKRLSQMARYKRGGGPRHIGGKLGRKPKAL